MVKVLAVCTTREAAEAALRLLGGEVRPSADSMRPVILKILGLRPYDVFMEFSATYPECLSMVVLADVGPAKMEEVVAFLRRQPGKMRLYARVVERRYARSFRGVSFKHASAMADELSIATVLS